MELKQSIFHLQGTDEGILCDDMQRFSRFKTAVKLVTKTASDEEVEKISDQLESSLYTFTSLMRRVVSQWTTLLCIVFWTDWSHAKESCVTKIYAVCPAYKKFIVSPLLKTWKFRDGNLNNWLLYDLLAIPRFETSLKCEQYDIFCQGFVLYSRQFTWQRPNDFPLWIHEKKLLHGRNIQWPRLLFRL